MFMFDKKYLHHAYLITTQGGEVLGELETSLEGVGIRTKGNPDYIKWNGETFGINDARKLKEQQGNKNLSGKQCFVVETLTITGEAQNALLKTFEEPGEDTHFFVCVPDEDTILPTLRSRMVLINAKIGSNKNTSETGEKFLKQTPGERIKAIEGIIQEKNRKGALLLLNGIEVAIHNYLHNNKQNTKDFRRTLDAIYDARSLITKNIGSTKLLLENIALLCPVLV